MAQHVSVGGNGSRLSLGLLHFILLVCSGWALKHYSNGRLGLAAYGLYFAHSIICTLRHTHPHPGQLQRRLCAISGRYAPVLFVTLIVGQLQRLAGKDMQLGADLSWRVVVLALYGSLLGFACIKSCLREKSKLASLLTRLERCNLTLCVLWNVYCLWHIAIIEEYWWSLGLAMLVLLNHFVLWRLTMSFNISASEIDTVGMCFSVIFAINATQELLEQTRL
ncbi:CG13014 [Drosophila busckii]|uniref:CG13014 n=1 Tax=Drosophila busckii TaxID=30019 RepID=A0A0M3QZE3_DROBS|nr:uncharacterized protein LOC108606436 [Drosophila busckii]ALC49273.1 CG13014 [Drosophila busckii]